MRDEGFPKLGLTDIATLVSLALAVLTTIGFTLLTPRAIFPDSANTSEEKCTREALEDIARGLTRFFVRKNACIIEAKEQHGHRR